MVYPSILDDGGIQVVKVLSTKVPDAVYVEFKAVCEGKRCTISDELFELITCYLECLKVPVKSEVEPK